MLTRAVSRRDSPETSLLYTGIVGAVMLSALGPFYWKPPVQMDWALLLLVAVLGAAAHFCLIKALKIAAASAIQPFSYSLFLWAIVVGFIGFGEFPSTWTLVGAAIVIASNRVFNIFNACLQAFKCNPRPAIRQLAWWNRRRCSHQIESTKTANLAYGP